MTHGWTAGEDRWLLILAVGGETITHRLSRQRRVHSEVKSAVVPGRGCRPTRDHVADLRGRRLGRGRSEEGIAGQLIVFGDRGKFHHGPNDVTRVSPRVMFRETGMVVPYPFESLVEIGSSSPSDS